MKKQLFHNSKPQKIQTIHSTTIFTNFNKLMKSWSIFQKSIFNSKHKHSFHKQNILTNYYHPSLTKKTFISQTIFFTNFFCWYNNNLFFLWKTFISQTFLAQTISFTNLFFKQTPIMTGRILHFLWKNLHFTNLPCTNKGLLTEGGGS